MASGLPCVATDSGGSREALVDGQGGRLVPPDPRAELAPAVLELARDRRRLPEMGRFNRQRVKELFSLEESARRLADWYLNGPSA